MGVDFMPTRVPSEAIKRARQLRRAMTDGEKKLWSELKKFRGLYGIHVRKQTPIGAYFPDFVIHEHRLIIEVDGEHHFTPEALARDAKRDAWLRGVGYRVIRFNTGELSENFDGCVEEILAALGLMSATLEPVIAPPPLTPPLKGEGGIDVSESPSPLRGGVRGGGNSSQDVSAGGSR